MLYHINKDKGAMPCSAKKGNCPYGASSPHFATEAEAQIAYENIMSNANGLRAINKKQVNRKINQDNQRIEVLNYDSLEEIADRSIEDYDNLSRVADYRGKIVDSKIKTLQSLSQPEDIYSSLKGDNYLIVSRDVDGYRNKTAEIIEASTESRFFNTNYHFLQKADQIGSLNRVEDYNSFINSRVTLGSSDVSLLAVNDFGKDVPTYFKVARENMLISRRSNNKRLLNSHSLKNLRSGEKYRSAVWGEKLRGDFSINEPEYKLYSNRGLYFNKDRDWQVVELKNIISDSSNNKPIGYLETYSSSDLDDWSNGIPLRQRAGILYKLNASNLEFAEVRSSVNDNRIVKYRVYRDDEVAPGSGVTMNEYIKDKIRSVVSSLKG